MQTVSINIISSPAVEDRTGEDGWLAIESRVPPGWISAAVIDGASTRLALPSLVRYLSERANTTSPAVWASCAVRSELCKAFGRQPPVAPAEALEDANRVLRLALEEVPNMAEVYHLTEHRPVMPFSDALRICTKSLSAELEEAFLAIFPRDEWHLLDTRHLRLLLPACACTAVRFDLSGSVFDFAHAGDTALVKIDAAGAANLPTQDQMAQFDDATLETAMKAVSQRHLAIEGVIQAFREVPAVRKMDVLNGVRHNYVDKNGHAQPMAGCGVINGLPELSHYIQTGRGNISGGERLYLMTDGLTLPFSLHDEETLPIAIRDGLSQWWQALRTGQLTKVCELIRRIEDLDASGNSLPRAKQHDDATAMVIALS